MSKISKVALAGGAAVLSIGLAAGAAVADPPSGIVPAHNAIVGTGSDTTQLALDKISLDYRNANPKARKFYSFDAVGSPTITEKNGCGKRTRPNGSGAGVAELEANLRPSGDTADYCVDFARSSKGRQPTDPSSIVYVPFGIDAVTWSADGLNAPSNAPQSMTVTQLKAIYSCDASIIKSNLSGPVTWNEVGGNGTAKVIPVIPQSSSGTRSFFLAQIGVTTLGTCVQGQDNSVEENEGTNAIFTNASTAKNIVFPYSVAVFLAQSQNGHGTGTQGKTQLRQIAGQLPLVSAGGGKRKINTSFPLVREVYNVVRNAGTATSRKVPGYLQGIFGTGKANTGFVCTSAAGKADIQSYGFALTPRCGTLE